MRSDERAQLLEFQGLLCALCRHQPEEGCSLPVDFDSEAGGMRGLLCEPCGRLLDGREIAFFRRCIRYLAFPPYQAMKEGWVDWDNE